MPLPEVECQGACSWGVVHDGDPHTDILPDLEAAYGEQFHLRMVREFQSVLLGADVKVPPQGDHVCPPSVCLFSKESIFGHSMISVKDQGM